MSVQEQRFKGNGRIQNEDCGNGDKDELFEIYHWPFDVNLLV